MRYFVVTVGILFGLVVGTPNTVSANSCVSRQRVVVQQQVVTVKQAVVTPIAVASFAAIPIQVPTYSVGYNQRNDYELEELRKAIQELRLAIQSLKQGSHNHPPENSDLQTKATQILVNRCARCHNEMVAEKEGGKFIMFQGGKLSSALSKENIFDIWERSDAGSMPPPGKGDPIPDEEARLLRDWIGQRAATERALKLKKQP